MWGKKNNSGMAQTSTVTPCVRGSQSAWLNYELVFLYLSFHFSCALTHLTRSGPRLSTDPVVQSSARDGEAPSRVRVVWIMRLDVHLFSKLIRAVADEIAVNTVRRNGMEEFLLPRPTSPPTKMVKYCG